MISHRYKYLYFVTPKCASATLRNSLKNYTDIGYPVTVNEQHVTIEAFLQSEDAHLFDEYMKFTFVRNPYDRLYSGYMQDRHAAKASPRWSTVKSPIFEEIGDDFNRYVHDFVATSPIHTAWDWICFCPMTAFSHLDGSYKLDWFGRAENFDTDLSTLSTKIGVEIQKSENVNVKTAPRATTKYLDKYTRGTIEIVNSLYKEDFTFFGYEMLNPGYFPRKLNEE